MANPYADFPAIQQIVGGTKIPSTMCTARFRHAILAIFGKNPFCVEKPFVHFRQDNTFTFQKTHLHCNPGRPSRQPLVQ
jgi:hypothetical protein